MKTILNSRLMKESDTYTINNKISSLELMENAGSKIASRIKKLINPCRVLLLCGKGGNGGDSFVVGRYLNEYDVSAYIISDDLTKECQINKDRYKGKMVNEITDSYDLIIDGLIGIGLNKNLNDKYLNVVNRVNEIKAIKVAIDIPTGLNSDNGLLLPNAIKCDYTFAIQNEKIGHYLNDGKDYCGKIEIIEIGVELIDEAKNSLLRLEESDFDSFFKKRKQNANKGDFKKVCMIAGSKELLGAGYISYLSLASLRVGAGYQTLCVPKGLFNLYALKNPEITLKMLDGNEYLKYNEKDLISLLNVGVIGIGMGLGISKDVYDTINYLLKNYNGRLLIDADGLNSLAEFGVDILLDKKCDVIVTPHLKEMERLTNYSVSEIKENSVKIAKEFALKYNVNIILKSSVSIITNGIDTFMNITGNSSLAKAGSGDVLSGIVCGLLTNGNIIDCMAVGSYLLGKCADNLVKKYSEYTIISSDVVDEIRNVIKCQDLYQIKG